MTLKRETIAIVGAIVGANLIGIVTQTKPVQSLDCFQPIERLNEFRNDLHEAEARARSNQPPNVLQQAAESVNEFRNDLHEAEARARSNQPPNVLQQAAERVNEFRNDLHEAESRQPEAFAPATTPMPPSVAPLPVKQSDLAPQPVYKPVPASRYTPDADGMVAGDPTGGAYDPKVIAELDRERARNMAQPDSQGNVAL